MSIENIYTRGNDNIRTPGDFYSKLDEEFHFDKYDPCPENPEGLREFDGLSPAPENVKAYYMNPPYSNCAPWIRKAIEDSSRGITVVMLLKSDTSTKWFHELVMPNAAVRFVKGRLKFLSGKPATFPSLIAVFQKKKREELELMPAQDFVIAGTFPPRSS